MSSAIAFPIPPVAGMLLDLQRELESLPHTQRLDDAQAEAVYALAYQEYNRARHDQALRYFQLLLVYRPTSTVYLLGAALCLQRLRRYEAAIRVFRALSLLDPQVPGHVLAMAECQLLCHERTQARESLEQLSAFCRDHRGHERVQARAQAMLELMKPHDEPLAT